MKIRAICAGALLATGFISGAALASSDAVLCVQKELSVLGYTPGPADGILTSMTEDASEAYRADMKRRDPNWGQPALNKGNAAFWCERVASAFPKVAYLYDAYRGVGKVDPGTPDLDRSGFAFDVADDVPAKRIAEVREGFEIAQAYMDKVLGGALPQDMIARIVVKVVATGKGNPDAGGAVATAGDTPDGRQPMLFFDVAHRDWSQNAKARGWSTATDNVKVVVHEYTHVWHRLLVTMRGEQLTLSSWINEGIAEYVAYNAMADMGRLRLDDVNAFMAGDGRSEEFGHSLTAYDRGDVSIWPGHVGYLAIDWLVSSSPHGKLSIRMLADELQAGRPVAQAFRTAFGLEQDDFYNQFEAFKTSLRKSPTKALANRRSLILAGGANVPAVDGSGEAATSLSIDTLAKCIQSGLNAAGYSVGSVDGAVGNGTRKAFENFAKASNLPSFVRLDEAAYPGLCLYLAKYHEIGATYEAFAERLIDQSNAYVRIGTPKEAVFKVRLFRDSVVIADVEEFDRVPFEMIDVYQAALPLRTIIGANKMCVGFLDGWVVKDAAGKEFAAGCSPLDPVLMTLPNVAFAYAAQRSSE